MTPFRSKTKAKWGLAGLLLLVGTGSARADIFVLTQGGRIVGQWLNPDKPTGAPYEIVLDAGGRMILDSSQVQRTVLQTPEENEYRHAAASHPDTVDGHWAIAEWCLQHKLKKQRQTHLQRIIELDPDHAGARRGLGYSQVRGQWTTLDQSRQDQGYQRHEGRWILSQHMQLAEERRVLEQAQKEWYAQLRRWREMLGGENAPEASRGLANLNDPLAIPALHALLREEKAWQVKMLYVETLGRIGNKASAAALIEASLSDPNEEIFYAAVKQLAKAATPHVTTPYLEALKDNNYVKVNRAAYALGQLGDASCISPLIDALTTKYVTIVPGNSNSHSATFSQPVGGSPFGGSSFSAGDQPRVFSKLVRTEEVLDSLIRLSGGENFDYDQQAWRYWLANENQRKTPVVQPRRESE